MVLLLNYLPYIIILCGLYIGYRQVKKHRGTDKVGPRVMTVGFLTVLSVVLLSALTAGYIPKASVQRIPPPDFTPVEGENAPKIENRLRKPDRTREEAAKHLNELSDWRAAKAQREEEKNQTTQALPLPPKE